MDDKFSQINKIICDFKTDECAEKDCIYCEGDGKIAAKTNEVLSLLQKWERGSDVGP